MDVVIARYWAGARAAAGVAEESIPVPGPITVTELLSRVLAAHETPAGLEKVLAVCSVMVDGRQLGTIDPASAVVHPGQTVEFLPPFAGG